LISPTFYLQLLCARIPKAQKIQSSWHSFFALLGSLYVKTAPKMLMKLTPEVNFINILHAYFLYESSFKAKLQAEESCSKDFCTKNLRLKHW